MSRITGSDAYELMEAYASVYTTEEIELTEEQIQEDFENWVNSFVEEGYDLSEYTWEDMYEEYLNEYAGSTSSSVTAADLIRQRQAQSARTASKPAPQNLRGLSIGQGGFRVNNRPVNPGMSPIFQRPGVAPSRPSAAAPAAFRPSVSRPSSSTSAVSRPAARPTVATKPAPSTNTSYAGVTGVRPVGTPLPTNAVRPVAGAPTQNAPISAPARPVNQLMTGMPSAPSMAAPSSGPKLSARAQALKAGGPQGGARARVLNQDFDPFDVVMGYLIDEGYADSEESALTIMANMSEEWKEEILDERNRGEQGMTMQQVRNRRDIRDGGIPGATYERAGGSQRSEHERNRGKKKTKSGYGRTQWQ